MPQHRAAVLIAVLLGLIARSPAFADTASDRVRDGIERSTGGQVAVDRISPTPVPGIFEVVSGADVFYSDATGRYAFIDGRLVDTQKKQDLTAATLAALARIDFESLPLNLAIKSVAGTGKRRLAVFEDPACPVCQQLHGTLARLKDVTVYVFAYPVVSEQSIPAAVAALCAPALERSARWNAFMTGTPAPSRIDPGCDQAQADLGKIIAFGEQHRIKNTPTLILGDGRRIVGGIPPDQLAAALDELGR